VRSRARGKEGQEPETEGLRSQKPRAKHSEKVETPQKETSRNNLLKLAVFHETKPILIAILGPSRLSANHVC
jgi:hypothetical protein